MSGYHSYLDAVTAILRVRADYNAQLPAVHHHHQTRLRQLDQQYQDLLALRHTIDAHYAQARQRADRMSLPHLFPAVVVPATRTPVDSTQLNRLISQQQTAVDDFVAATKTYKNDLDWARAQGTVPAKSVSGWSGRVRGRHGLQ
jgi:hypothetical protein